MSLAGEPPEAGKPPEDAESTSKKGLSVQRPPFTRPFGLSREPTTRRLDIQLQKERTSARLAYGLMAIFAGTVAVVFLFAFIEDAPGAVDLAVTILPYVGTPLALALGYYFGISAR